MSSIEERVVQVFSDWVRRGQGLDIWDAPVDPEPAFVPFPGHLRGSVEEPDDGRRPTFVSSLVRRLFEDASPEPQEVADEPVPEIADESPRREIQVLVPNEGRFDRDVWRSFLAGTSACRHPISLELLADGNRVAVLISSSEKDLPTIRRQIAAFFPDSVAVEADGTLENSWDNVDGPYCAITEFGLAHEFIRPIATDKTDPYVGLVGALETVRDGELGLIQVTFSPVRHPWALESMRSVLDDAGGSFFVDGQELVAETRTKVENPLYAVVLRVAARAKEKWRVEDIIGNVAAAVSALYAAGSNRLIPLSNTEYPNSEHIQDTLSRKARRSGMLLNADEVIALAHFPSEEVCSSKLARYDSATRRAPVTVREDEGIVLGTNTHAGVSSSVSLSADQRLRHTHLIGASGTGKSTLLFNLISQDIARGAGVGLLDPHGDLVDKILGFIPEHRVKDVVLIDPADTEFPVGFNVLHAHSELEKTLLASDLVSVFQRLSTSWGDQMGSVLNHAVLAFLESSEGGSLLELRRFLVEPRFREHFVTTVRDPEVAYYWRHTFSELAGGRSIGPILTRLETFLTPKAIRYMVSQWENRLDFADILDSGKIFLAKLSQGAIGRENSYLLGTLLVSKFQQLAMARQAVSAERRRDFFLYIDEFHNFISPSMAEILTGARKYRLGLTLAHQELRQLERDKEVASAVLGNCHTRVVFRVGDSDARTLESGFSHFKAKDIQNLGTGAAICRVERSDFDFNLAVSLPTFPSEEILTERKQNVVEASRAAYGRPRAEIEAERIRPDPEQVPGKEEQTTPPPKAEIRKESVSVQVPPPVVAEARIATKEKLLPVEPEPPSPGRGGADHKYLQMFVKQWAVGMGWKATIEAPVPGGAVDVLLSKGKVTIACEISMTTSTEHEIGNLKKCLDGGFSFVVSLCQETEHMRQIETAARDEFSRAELSRLRFFTQPNFFAFIEELDAKTAAKETTVRGYKVKVKYRPIEADEQAKKMGDVAAVVAKSLGRKIGR